VNSPTAVRSRDEQSTEPPSTQRYWIAQHSRPIIFLILTFGLLGAYLAFTIGMTFQVSDTAVSSPRIRRAVLLHSTLSFIYNTAIRAFVLNLLFGLAS